MAIEGEQCAPWDTPVGPLLVSWGPGGVTGIAPAALLFPRLRREPPRVAGLPDRLRAALDRRLHGDPTAEVDVDLGERTSFERDVLAAAEEIPYGEVRPYGWIARRIGRPAAVRAVGSALGRNPVPVVVPCHRVVRSDGQMGHYAFGDEMKARLLALEGVAVAHHVEVA